MSDKVEKLKKLKSTLQALAKANQANQSEDQQDREAMHLALILSSLGDVTEGLRDSQVTKSEMLDAIRGMKIDVPETKVPAINIPEIKLPTINVPKPEVTVNVPEIKVPEAKVTVDIPEIKVPEPKVTVNVEKPDAPIVNIPDEMTVSGEVGINNPRNKPVPTTLVDFEGKPVSLGGGSNGSRIGKSSLLDVSGEKINPATAENQLDYRFRHAIAQVEDTYGDIVSVESKKKTLRKFGRNPSVDTTFETLWRTGGDETYATSNVIDKISSSDNGDTQSVVIEGHTISNGELTFVSQTKTLQGQTESALTTPLARVTRMYNNGTTDFAGTVYIYEDDTVASGVPQTASKIHMTVVTGSNQSEKASTSISKNDYWFITEFVGYCFDKSSAVVEFEVQIREVGATNKVFRRIFETAGTNGIPTLEQFDPVIIIPKNHDVRIRAKADNASTDIGGSLSGYLASVT